MRILPSQHLYFGTRPSNSKRKNHQRMLSKIILATALLITSGLSSKLSDQEIMNKVEDVLATDGYLYKLPTTHQQHVLQKARQGAFNPRDDKSVRNFFASGEFGKDMAAGHRTDEARAACAKEDVKPTRSGTQQDFKVDYGQLYRMVEPRDVVAGRGKTEAWMRNYIAGITKMIVGQNVIFAEAISTKAGKHFKGSPLASKCARVTTDDKRFEAATTRLQQVATKALENSPRPKN